MSNLQVAEPKTRERVPLNGVADDAPTPVECLLHAIAACITSGIGNIAAARG